MALTAAYRYGLRRSPCLISSVGGAAVMMTSSSSIAAARCASGSSQLPAHSAMRRVTRSHSIITSHHHSNSSRAKGDYGFNVFHNSNPQHGGSYARHERRMREDEVDDFLKSVKGWTPVWETAEGETPAATGTEASGDASSAAAPPPSRLKLGDEAITKTFTFQTFNDAYLFMGRLWAFCYGSDKYPHVVWQGCAVTVSLYSPSFKGLSKREARLAAFLNDQFNMLKKSAVQKAKVMGSALDTSTSSVEALVGEHVRRTMEEREQRRQKELQESLVGQKRWEELLTNPAPPPTP